MRRLRKPSLCRFFFTPPGEKEHEDAKVPNISTLPQPDRIIAIHNVNLRLMQIHSRRCYAIAHTTRRHSARPSM